MKEDDIRPRRFEDEIMKVHKEDIARLLTKKKQFVEVPCPACESTDAHEAFIKYDLSYKNCRDCETVYVSPRPTETILEDYYNNSKTYDFWNKHIFPASEDSRREKIFKPRANKILDLCKTLKINPGICVDVGAGFGTFCQELIRRDYFSRVIAVELTPELSDTCRKRGLDVIQKPIQNVRFDQPVDLITSFEVIEHLFSPREFILDCLKHLAPGGLIVLTCPNIKGFDMQVLQQKADAVDNEHLNYFHPESLSRLVAGCGYDVLEISTPGKLDAELVRKAILDEEFNVDGDRFLKRVLIDDWARLGGAFQTFLQENKLSSHMWLVARKILG